MQATVHYGQEFGVGKKGTKTTKDQEVVDNPWPVEEKKKNASSPEAAAPACPAPQC